MRDLPVSLRSNNYNLPIHWSAQPAPANCLFSTSNSVKESKKSMVWFEYCTVTVLVLTEFLYKCFSIVVHRNWALGLKMRINFEKNIRPANSQIPMVDITFERFLKFRDSRFTRAWVNVPCSTQVLAAIWLTGLYLYVKQKTWGALHALQCVHRAFGPLMGTNKSTHSCLYRLAPEWYSLSNAPLARRLGIFGGGRVRAGGNRERRRATGARIQRVTTDVLFQDVMKHVLCVGNTFRDGYLVEWAVCSMGQSVSIGLFDLAPVAQVQFCPSDYKACRVECLFLSDVTSNFSGLDEAFSVDYGVKDEENVSKCNVIIELLFWNLKTTDISIKWHS